MRLASALAIVVAAVSAEAVGAPHSTDLAAGIVALARDGRITDPRIVEARTGIPLRNPQKFTDQPMGTSRGAQWRWPPSRWGISELQINEEGSADLPMTALSLDLFMTGRPCFSITDLERAARSRARFGGTVFAMVLDGPGSGPVQLGDKHASIVLRSHRGTDVTLAAESTRPRRGGCILSLNLQTERKRP